MNKRGRIIIRFIMLLLAINICVQLVNLYNIFAADDRIVYSPQAALDIRLNMSDGPILEISSNGEPVIYGQFDDVVNQFEEKAELVIYSPVLRLAKKYLDLKKKYEALLANTKTKNFLNKN